MKEVSLMKEYHINGGNKIYGEVKINGGKNAILPILASTVLNAETSIIHNCPKISDTYIALDILREVGCKVSMEGNTIIVDSSGADECNVPDQLVREMRSSIIFLGSMLGRFKKVRIGYPGGCELGARPIDLHLKGLRQLGAEIVEEHGFLICTAEKLVGARTNLDFPSVGATENIMLAAVFAQGQSIISNAAKEPEIVDLQNFLNGMGAKIRGAGTDTIYVEGVSRLHETEYSVMPDRIVAGTFLVAAAMTKGEIVVRNVVPQDLVSVSSKLIECGCTLKEEKDAIYLKAPERIMAVRRIQTHPHPGFPTDMQPQFMAMLSLAQGTSTLHETVFESRTKHMSEFSRMGADIILSPDGMTAIINGVKKLNGTEVVSKDLRGGAALILAGLAAEGKTIVTGTQYVERGYESIEKTLALLGADIKYIH